jgi:uncharacterized protein YkwD
LCPAFPVFAADSSGSQLDSSAFSATKGAPILQVPSGSSSGSASGSVRAMATSSDINCLFSFDYITTDARAMLSSINSFRTGSEAWAWNESNTERVSYSGLSELTYDYDLEQIAITRAAELAIMYADTGEITHMRPNGKYVDELGEALGYTSIGENILCGSGMTAAQAMEAWKETDYGYDGQGHRRTMLDDYDAVAIAHISISGIDFWVQEFASPVRNSTETDIPDGTYNVWVPFKESDITNVTAAPDEDQYAISLSLGNSYDVLPMVITADLLDNLDGIITMVNADSWTSADTSIATVSNGVVTAKTRGITYITGTKTINGTSISANCRIFSGLFFDAADSSSWYFTPVYWAVDNGITSGTGNGYFSPDQTCTRAQAVTFLWNAAGQPTSSGSSSFSDVASSSWYFNAVNWAVKNGITDGTGNGCFSPDMNCTRAQIVKLIWNAFGNPAPSSSTTRFSDVGQNEWYTQAVLWAYENGITSGTGDGTTFSPNQACTRSQIVTMLYNAASISQ